MSEWLELELARQLAPVEAPLALVFRPSVRHDSRRSFSLSPILATIAAAATLILVTLPGAMAPASVNHYLRNRAGIRLLIPDRADGRIQDVRVLERQGSRIAALSYRVGSTQTTILIARAAAVQGSEWKSHGTYAIASADPQLACVLCHADL